MFAIWVTILPKQTREQKAIAVNGVKSIKHHRQKAKDIGLIFYVNIYRVTKETKCEACQAFYFFRNQFNKFNGTGA